MKGQQMSAGQGQPRVSSGHVRFSTNTQGNSPVPAPRERESRHYIHHVKANIFSVLYFSIS